jgi:methionine synthase I (cobalamin-dependent)
VGQVALSYVQAGSQIILTNTFGANRFRLKGFGAADKVREINQAGVTISLQAAGKEALVFASLGPSGHMLMNGDVTEDELKAAFDEQAKAMAEAGAHAIVVETMSDLEEASIAIQSAKATGLPVVASVVFDSGKEMDRTMMGATPEKVAATLANAGADVVGANCGQGILGYIRVCERLHKATSLPIWIKANAGLPEMVDGKAIYRTGPADFAQHVPALIKAGATFIGGCCGTSPEYIRAVKSVLKSNR